MYKDETDLRSISTTAKKHKFFERFLENDLNALTAELQLRYQMIEQAKLVGVSPVGEFEAWADSHSVSTMKWSQYNVFQFHIPGIYELYKAVGDMVREACDYYEIDFDAQQFMLQGWFNINHSGVGKLGWHEHGKPGAPDFHGYYSVSAEPSSTHYIVFDDEIENINKNNRAILSEMGHPHTMGDWNWDGPRITIAYDVTPLETIRRDGGHVAEQHWVPLR